MMQWENTQQQQQQQQQQQTTTTAATTNTTPPIPTISIVTNYDEEIANDDKQQLKKTKTSDNQKSKTLICIGKFTLPGGRAGEAIVTIILSYVDDKLSLKSLLETSFVKQVDNAYGDRNIMNLKQCMHTILKNITLNIK